MQLNIVRAFDPVRLITMTYFRESMMGVTTQSRQEKKSSRNYSGNSHVTPRL